MPFNLQTTAIYLLAIMTAVCGTWVLQIAWRSTHRKWHLVSAGWVLVFASLYVWTFTTAADKGVALGIIAWVIVGLFFLLHSAIKSPVRKERQIKKRKTENKQTVNSNTGKTQIASNTLIALIIGPFAGISAMLLSTLLLLVMQALKVEYTVNLAIASLLFPVLWASLAVILGYQQRLQVRLMTVASVGFGSLACLFVIS